MIGTFNVIGRILLICSDVNVNRVVGARKVILSSVRWLSQKLELAVNVIVTDEVTTYQFRVAAGFMSAGGIATFIGRRQAPALREQEWVPFGTAGEVLTCRGRQDPGKGVKPIHFATEKVKTGGILRLTVWLVRNVGYGKLGGVCLKWRRTSCPSTWPELDSMAVL